LIAPNGWVWWRFDCAKLGAFNEEFRVFDCPKWMGLMKGWSHQIGCFQWRFWLCLMGGFNESLDCTKWVGYVLKSFANVQRMWQVCIWNLSLIGTNTLCKTKLEKCFLKIGSYS
jgi:hypothetical protein